MYKGAEIIYLGGGALIKILSDMLVTRDAVKSQLRFERGLFTCKLILAVFLKVYRPEKLAGLVGESV